MNALDDRIELIELPDDPAEWGGRGGGLFGAIERHGFEAGRRRGFREALALVSLAAEELIANEGVGDVPPSVLRQLAAAVSSRLAGHAPVEPFVEGGLGI